MLGRPSFGGAGGGFSWKDPGEAFPPPIGPEKKITPVQTHGGPSNLNLLTTKSNANSY